MSDNVCVCGYTLERDWFDTQTAMNAFAYAIERAVALQGQVKDTDLELFSTPYYIRLNVNNVEVKIDGVDSQVSIDGVWVVGNTMNPDNGDRIVATKKEVDEFFSGVVLMKPVRIKKS